jgi:glyoxylase-like metal-dependent hydrolase (beta-lactamase superfamily II)
MITNAESGTNLHEIVPGIYRINTPVDLPGGFCFNFNQYLIADAEPLVFHTGPRRMFPLVAEAIGKVLPLATIRYVAFSHVEADECGALNEFLAAAPQAVPICGQLAAMVSVNDLADRPARALADGEVLRTGKHALRWFDAPHVPHGWDCGFMMETETRTLLCGDLFTQGGAGATPITESDILGPSEAFRAPRDYYAHAPHTDAVLEHLARQRPQVLACMHGSAWQGDGAALLLALAKALAASVNILGFEFEVPVLADLRQGPMCLQSTRNRPTDQRSVSELAHPRVRKQHGSHVWRGKLTMVA